MIEFLVELGSQILGAATLLVFPQHVITSPMTRAAAVAVVPLALGFAFALLERLKASSSSARPLRRFLTAFALALGFAGVRYLFAR